MEDRNRRDFSGALFKNERKEKDSHPDYKGSAVVDDVDYWIDAWLKKDRNDKTYMSISFKKKDR